MKPLYEVVVGGVGQVYNGRDLTEAERMYDHYANLSQTKAGGRAYGEDVTLFRDGEPFLEYEGGKVTRIYENPAAAKKMTDVELAYWLREVESDVHDGTVGYKAARRKIEAFLRQQERPSIRYARGVEDFLEAIQEYVSQYMPGR